MQNRMGLAASLLLLAALGVVILGLVAGVVAQAGWSDLGGAALRVARAARALPSISPGAARAGQRALADSALAVVLAALVAVPCGLASATLSAGLAWLGRTLLGVPAWALLLMFLLAATVSPVTESVAQSCAGALAVLRGPVGLPAALTLLWLPVLAARVEQAARDVDPVQVRTHAGLGIGPAGRLWRLVLPAIALPLAGGAVAAFLVTAALLLLDGGTAAYEGSVAPSDLALVAVAGAAILSPLTAWFARPR